MPRSPRTLFFSMSAALMAMMTSACPSSGPASGSCCPAQTRAAPGWRGSRQTACRQIPGTACPRTGRCAPGYAGTGASDTGRYRSPVWPCPHLLLSYRCRSCTNLFLFILRNPQAPSRLLSRRVPREFLPDFVEIAGSIPLRFYDRIIKLTTFRVRSVRAHFICLPNRRTFSMEWNDLLHTC